MRTFRRICVYCGSSNAVSARYLDAAEAVGAALARRGVGVVYGGGKVGLMGRVANGALAAGGQVIGVIPDRLQDLEVGHPDLTELYVVDSMHARKMMMAQLSDAFIAMPGGFGTLEELAEVTTWTQLNYHRKPVGLLNLNGYYDPLLAWVQRAIDDGFIRPQHRDLLTSATELDALLEILATVEIPELTQWLRRP
ncbi:MAG: TIGR00730 family Rossman fold protein [Myxococcota bacterium]